MLHDVILDVSNLKANERQVICNLNVTCQKVEKGDSAGIYNVFKKLSLPRSSNFELQGKRVEQICQSTDNPTCMITCIFTIGQWTPRMSAMVCDRPNVSDIHCS